jgi:hypothetical protein
MKENIITTRLKQFTPAMQHAVEACVHSITHCIEPSVGCLAVATVRSLAYVPTSPTHPYHSQSHRYLPILHAWEDIKNSLNAHKILALGSLRAATPSLDGRRPAMVRDAQDGIFCVHVADTAPMIHRGHLRFTSRDMMRDESRRRDDRDPELRLRSNGKVDIVLTLANIAIHLHRLISLPCKSVGRLHVLPNRPLTHHTTVPRAPWW